MEEQKISLSVKTRLHEALVLSTLLYSAELWPVAVTQMKKLEVAHHRWQRSILGISWKDKATNESQRGNCTPQVRRHYQMQTTEVAWTSVDDSGDFENSDSS